MPRICCAARLPRRRSPSCRAPASTPTAPAATRCASISRSIPGLSRSREFAGSAACSTARSPAESALQHDGGKTVAEILLAFQTGAPIAEEARLLGDGVAGGTLDRADAGGDEAALDVAGDVEHEMARPPRRSEEIAIVGILGEKACREFRPDLVGTLRDAGADGGAHAEIGRAS